MSGVLYPTENTQNEFKNIGGINNYNQLLYFMLNELTSNQSISEELQSKLHDILIYYKIKQTMKISLGHDTFHNILGLTKLEAPKFSCEEENLIFDFAKDRLHYYANNNKNNNFVLDTDKLLLELRGKLNRVMISYSNNLIDYQKILDSMKAMHCNNVPEFCINKIQGLNENLLLSKTKQDILNATVKKSVLTETEVSLDAYKELLKAIQKQQEEYKLKIGSLKEEKLKYEIIDCKEYQDILKDFIHYMNAIEKIQRMHKLLNQVNNE